MTNQHSITDEYSVYVTSISVDLHHIHKTRGLKDGHGHVLILSSTTASILKTEFSLSSNAAEKTRMWVFCVFKICLFFMYALSSHTESLFIFLDKPKWFETFGSSENFAPSNVFTQKVESELQ